MKPILTLLVALLGATCLQAQIPNILMNKIERKLEQKVEQKADEAADSVANKVWTKATGGQPAQYQQVYTFSTRILTSYWNMDAKGKSDTPVEMYSLYGESDEYQGSYSADPKNQNQKSIFDYPNGSMINLSEDNGKKTATILPIRNMANFMIRASKKVYVEDPSAPATQPTTAPQGNPGTVTKTGKTKTIAGYRCEQYIYESQDMRGEVWHTTELKHSSLAFLQYFAPQMATYGQGTDQANMPTGIMMEGHFTQLKDGSTSHILVKAVDKQPETYKLADYEVTNLGGNLPRN
ncbi:MAG: DUF4412 domain-containing protein [Bacteroidetes bacterium]|nr:MAG: DUF4412 domain-containing protein [Bacteroidota bacterium]